MSPNKRDCLVAAEMGERTLIMGPCPIDPIFHADRAEPVYANRFGKFIKPNLGAKRTPGGALVRQEIEGDKAVAHAVAAIWVTRDRAHVVARPAIGVGAGRPVDRFQRGYRSINCDARNNGTGTTLCEQPRECGLRCGCSSRS